MVRPVEVAVLATTHSAPPAVAAAAVRPRVAAEVEAVAVAGVVEAVEAAVRPVEEAVEEEAAAAAGW